MKILLALNSSNEVMMAQRNLKKAGIRLSIVAMPREISHNCGVALIFAHQDLERVRTVIDRNVYGEAIYFLEQDGKYEKIS